MDNNWIRVKNGSAATWFPSVFNIEADGTFCTRAIGGFKNQPYTERIVSNMPRSTDSWRHITPHTPYEVFEVCEKEQAEVIALTDWQGRNGMYNVEHVYSNFFWVDEIIKCWDNTLTNMNCFAFPKAYYEDPDKKENRRTYISIAKDKKIIYLKKK